MQVPVTHRRKMEKLTKKLNINAADSILKRINSTHLSQVGYRLLCSRFGSRNLFRFIWSSWNFTDAWMNGPLDRMCVNMNESIKIFLKSLWKWEKCIKNARMEKTNERKRRKKGKNPITNVMKKYQRKTCRKSRERLVASEVHWI